MTSTPFACAAGVAAAIACRTASTSDTARLSRRSWPVSAFETSSRSPVSCACSRTLRSIDSSPRADVVESSLPVRSRWSQPSTELSGVRSSWEIVARNSSFMRPADSVSLRATWASRACSSATLRARRNSETRAVRSSPCTTKSARWVPVARTFQAASGCQAPTSAPVTVAASAGPVPASHALAMTAVASRRNRLPSSITDPEERSTTNTAPTAASATAKRSGAGRVRNGYASAGDIVNSPAP